MKQMTTAEAREAGLLNASKTRKPRTTRKTEPRNGAESRCVACGATFTSDAAETKHVEVTHHSRYESTVT